VQALLEQAHDRYRSVAEGSLSTVYPVLERADPAAFGLSVVSSDGTVHTAGDAEAPFTIMSVAKPFVFALVCQRVGPERARHEIGVDATGLPFNALAAIERVPDGRTNPMVNPGAITTTSLVPGSSLDERWDAIQRELSRFAGRPLELDEETCTCARATNQRNRSIAQLLASYGRLHCEATVALELYTRQSALRVTARDLATMGATLADGGVNPVTGERVVDAAVCHHTLAVMATAGLYESSGDWLYRVGLPGKSGIGGGIVTVAPGKGALGTFAPPLDAAGNSVRGSLAAAFLSRQLGLNLFASDDGGGRGERGAS
jgi:glutaminase